MGLEPKARGPESTLNIWLVQRMIVHKTGPALNSN
jgi:hypothetical protein